MTTQLTLFEKIWSQHVVVDKGGEALLYIDRNLLHDGAFHAFTALAKEGRKVRKPRQQLATADHYVPTRARCCACSTSTARSMASAASA